MDGIVVRAHPSGDSDLIIRVITDRRGKIALFVPHARSSRKRFGASIDVLDYGTLETKRGRGRLQTLSSFTPISSFPAIRGDLTRLCCAAVVCEAFDLLIPEEGDESEEPLHVLQLALRSLESSEDVKPILRICFLALATLLSITGFDAQTAGARASAKNLRKLLDKVEHLAEKKLHARTAVDEILDRLEKKS